MIAVKLIVSIVLAIILARSGSERWGR